MKKWYQSKKFWVAMVVPLLTLINIVVHESTGYEIPVEGLASVLIAALGYIFVEGSLDSKSMTLKDKMKQIDPVNDPVLRSVITSLIKNKYDFKAASDDLGKHTTDVINDVLTSISSYLTIDTAQTEMMNSLKNEIASHVTTLYDQDQKFTEGVTLAKK